MRSFMLRVLATHFIKEKSGHKRDAKRSPEQPVYKHLNGVGWENVEIVLIESFPCKSKTELHARERYWIETMKPELNKVIPSTRTAKERNEANKEMIAERDKRTFKEMIAETERAIQRAKERSAANRDKILLQQSQKKHCKLCESDVH